MSILFISKAVAKHLIRVSFKERYPCVPVYHTLIEGWIKVLKTQDAEYPMTDGSKICWLPEHHKFAIIL